MTLGLGVAGLIAIPLVIKIAGSAMGSTYLLVSVLLAKDVLMGVRGPEVKETPKRQLQSNGPEVKNAAKQQLERLIELRSQLKGIHKHEGGLEARQSSIITQICEEQGFGDPGVGMCNLTKEQRKVVKEDYRYQAVEVRKKDVEVRRQELGNAYNIEKKRADGSLLDYVDIFQLKNQVVVRDSGEERVMEDFELIALKGALDHFDTYYDRANGDLTKLGWEDEKKENAQKPCSIQ